VEAISFVSSAPPPMKQRVSSSSASSCSSANRFRDRIIFHLCILIDGFCLRIGSERSRLARRSGHKEKQKSGAKKKTPNARYLTLRSFDRTGTLIRIRRSFFMHMKVSADQFELNGEKLRHVPTGAEFWAAEKDVVLCDEGLAGKADFGGNDYDPEELKQVAWKIFQQERTSCT
jgi:hypothetical protein